MAELDKKIRRIKTLIKNIVIDNGSIADEISCIQDEMEIVKAEREYLFNKLVEFEPQVLDNTSTNNNGDKRENKRKNSSSTSESVKPLKKKMKAQLAQSSNQKPTFVQHPVPQSSLMVPKTPIHLDGINVLSFGSFNSCVSTFPSGYKIVRRFGNKGRNYICKILHDNSNRPLFQIYPTNDVNNMFSASSANEAFIKMVKAHDPNNGMYKDIDGDSFFGLKNEKIRNHLEVLSNARKILKIKEETFFDPHNYTM